MARNLFVAKGVLDDLNRACSVNKCHIKPRRRQEPLRLCSKKNLGAAIYPRLLLARDPRCSSLKVSAGFNLDEDNLGAITHDNINFARFGTPPLRQNMASATFVYARYGRFGR